MTNFPPIPGSLTEDHAGLWAAQDGQGIDLQVKNGLALLYWYTHDDSGKARFFYGSFPLTAESFELLTTTGGTIADPTRAARDIHAGRASLLFQGEHGILRWNMPSFGRGQANLRRVA